MEEKQDVEAKNNKQLWKDWINSILLGLVLVCCIVILAFVLKDKNATDNSQISNGEATEIANNQVEDLNTQVNITTPESNVDEEASNDTGYIYESWDNCFPNIIKGGQKLKLNQVYALFVAIKDTDTPAFVPNGNWKVFINEEQLLNNGSSFILTDESFIGKKVKIEYVIDNKTELSRECVITK